MGMTDRQIRVWQGRLPLAAGVILTGVRVAVVISVGVATSPRRWARVGWALASFVACGNTTTI
jgi:hypothetical protein